MTCPEQSRSSYRSFRVESRSGPFWRAEARSGKGELLPILLDIASRRAAPPLPGLGHSTGWRHPVRMTLATVRYMAVYRPERLRIVGLRRQNVLGGCPSNARPIRPDGVGVRRITRPGRWTTCRKPTAG